MADKCNWRGASGKGYLYDIYSIDNQWDNVPGNYIFTKRLSPHSWTAVYIGETKSFKECLPNHSELPCIRSNGGTHIHAHLNRNTQARLAEEKDLLTNNPTPCNG